MADEEAPADPDGLQIQFGEAVPKPDGFNPDHWTIIKHGSKRVAAQHVHTGESRKLPKSWFEGE